MNDGKRTTGIFSWRSLKGSNSPPSAPTAKAANKAELASVGALYAFRSSGLFLQDWYLSIYRDVAEAKIDPLRHFLEIGWKEGRKPNPFFDPLWYLEMNSESPSASSNPLLHYWSAGEKNNRNPSPLFDTHWYRKTYAAEIGNGSPLAHYLRNRHLKRHSPNPFFDIEFYLRKNPDVAAADVDPLEHFISTGYKEGRAPSATFDPTYYSQKYLRNDERDPLTHFMEVGRVAKLPTQRQPDVKNSASEIRRFTSKSSDFEEINPRIGLRLPPQAKAIAFYLPQFHAIPENDKWWGSGFTEWTNVARGTPRFVGHYQPRVPRDFGFYDLSQPGIMAKQIRAAKAAGIFGFCFYYYNFNGKRLLQTPIETFLNEQTPDFPFCVMWANENWTRRWDGAESEVLMQQNYTGSDAEVLVDDLLRHFKDTRYIRLSGRPLLLIYRADVIPNVKETVQNLRMLFEMKGDERPIIMMAQAFDNNDPRDFGFDGAYEFPPHKLTRSISTINSQCEVLDDNFTSQVYRYTDVVKASLSEHTPDFPLIKTVVPAWDNDARRQGHGLIITDSTPSLYSEWLGKIVDRSRRNPCFGESIVFINAWNEWAEGAYLEPDLHFGGAYLNATSKALRGLSQSSSRLKVVLIGHDAFPAGAQLLLLNLAKTLMRQFGLEVEIVICGDGALLPQYQSVCVTHLCNDAGAIAATVDHLATRGFQFAITNTVASGLAVDALKKSGYTILSLVHELPRLISEKHLVTYAKEIARKSDYVIFPAQIVKDKFETEVEKVSSRALVRHQGIYQQLQQSSSSREELATELSIPSDSKFVVNIGYGDLRKGLDLFCILAKLVSSQRPDVHFVWVGDIDQNCAIWLTDARFSPNVHFVGSRSDVSMFLSAADVFALTSREDPFPSVALEAMQMEVPIVAFDNTGGIAELLLATGLGSIAEYSDPVSMSNLVLQVLNDQSASTQKRAIQAANYVRENFQFDDYAFDLVKLCKPEVPRISVIVPNYNYAQYLDERLRSIFSQAAPLFEIIVLDDASRDTSIDVLEEIKLRTDFVFRVVQNSENSGSVFSQWAKGIELARGELIWIAEADDLSQTDFLSTLAPLFEDTSIGFAFSDSRAIGSDGSELPLSYKEYYSQVFDGALTENLLEDAKLFARKYLKQRNTILNVSAVLWRKDCLQGALNLVSERLSDFKLAGDWLIYLAACQRCAKVAYISDQKNFHRRHAGGVTSSTAIAKQIDEIRRVHSYFRETFGDLSGDIDDQEGYIKDLVRQRDVGSQE